MSDEKRYDPNSQDELDSSLEDLLSLAFVKKKEKEQKRGLDFKFSDNNLTKQTIHENREEVFNTSAVDVDDIVKQANAVKSNKATIHKIDSQKEDLQNEEDFDLVSESDETKEMSIEDMVANAMNGRKKGKTRVIERVATEDDAISDEELEEVLANDEMYKQFVEHADEVEKKKWYQNKALIVGLSVTAVFLVMVGIVTAIFFDYYGKIKDETIYKPQAGNQGEVTPDDTVDAYDYEKWLKDQLSGIADNTMSNENVTNILIIAEDLRDTTGDSRGNTDVMILASINKEAKTLTLSSFMRDIYCDIPGYYAARLNSAYAKGGPDVLMKTLQTNFGVVVDKYVLVNFYSFIDIVEAIGGIEAEVTQAQIDAMFAPMNEQNRILGNAHGTDYIYKPGKYTLNGNQALAYARIRKGVGDDFGRTSRQREVIFTAISKAKNLSMFEIKALVDKILDNNMVKTNLSEGEVASLILNCFEYMDYEQQQLQIPSNGTWSGVIIRGMDVLSVNFLKNAQLLQETIYGSSNIDLSGGDGEYINTYTTTTTTTTIATNPPTVTTTTPTPVTTPVTTTPPVTVSSPTATTTTQPQVSDSQTATTPEVTTPPETSPTSETTPTSATGETTTTPEVTTPPETSPTSDTTPTTTTEKTVVGE